MYSVACSEQIGHGRFLHIEYMFCKSYVFMVVKCSSLILYAIV